MFHDLRNNIKTHGIVSRLQEQHQDFPICFMTLGRASSHLDLFKELFQDSWNCFQTLGNDQDFWICFKTLGTASSLLELF